MLRSSILLHGKQRQRLVQQQQWNNGGGTKMLFQNVSMSSNSHVRRMTQLLRNSNLHHYYDSHPSQSKVLVSLRRQHLSPHSAFSFRRMMTVIPSSQHHHHQQQQSMVTPYYHPTRCYPIVPTEQQQQQQQQQQQRRTFASSNSPKKKSNTTNKPQHHKPAEAGRIVLHQSNIKKLKPGQVKLCSGCGTEVRRASTKNDTQISAHQIIAGVDADRDVERSKKQTKKARYADAVDMDKGAFLCDRCKALQSENIFRAYDALADVSPEVFSSQLQHIVGRRRYGLCIVVVDSTDPEHSAVKNLRKIIGQKTPIWLVMNKIDLIPALDRRSSRLLSTRIASIMGLGQIRDYFLISSITGKGIMELAERILQSLGGKDIFIVGCANVGKSTLVHRLAGTIATAAYLKGRRGQTRRELCNNLPVTGSHLPGTTLQAVRIPCFSSDRHALWDTPGIINRKAIQYSLFPVHIMEPMARPEVIPLPSKEAGTQGHWRNGYSVLIEAKWMDSDEEVVDTEAKTDDASSAVEKMNDDDVLEDITVSDDEYDEDETNDEEDNDEDNNEKELRMNDEKEMNEEGEEEFERKENTAHNSAEDTDDDNNGYEGETSGNYDDDSNDVKSSRKRQAHEKKMAIIAAAKERRRLKEKSNDSEPSKKDTKPTKQKVHNNYRGPFVLGRIDLVNVANGDSVYAQAFLHPSLRIRIVPTDEAPDHATVPSHYLTTIRRRMEQAAGQNGAMATKLKPSYSIPLKPFLQMQSKGEITPGDKEYNEGYDSFYMDIVFASLGWIAISHRGSFTVIPHCVEGSVFSKRPSIYPTNISTRVVSNPDYEEGSFANLSEEEAMDRLRSAAKMGRHAGGGGSPNDAAYQQYRGSSGASAYGEMAGQDNLFDFESSFSNGPGDDEWY